MDPRRFTRDGAGPLLLAVLIAAGLQAAQQPAPVIPTPLGTHTENGLAGYAKILCSGVFVSGRAPEGQDRATEVNGYSQPL